MEGNRKVQVSGGGQEIRFIGLKRLDEVKRKRKKMVKIQKVNKKPQKEELNKF